MSPNDPQLPSTLNLVVGPALAGRMEAQQQVDTVMNASRGVAGEVRTKSGGRTDPAYVPDAVREMFESWSMPDLVANAHKIVPAVLQSSAAQWHDIAATIEAAGFWPNARITKVMAGAWQGSTADEAQQAARQLATALNQFGRIAEAVGLRVKAVGYAGEAVKNTVASSTGHANTYRFNVTDPAQSFATTSSNDELRRHAVEAMNSIYKPNFFPAGDGIPSYTPPPDVATGFAPGSTSPPHRGPTGPGVPGDQLPDDQRTRPGDPGRSPHANDPQSAGQPRPDGGDPVDSRPDHSRPATVDPAGPTTAAGTSTGVGPRSAGSGGGLGGGADATGGRPLGAPSLGSHVAQVFGAPGTSAVPTSGTPGTPGIGTPPTGRGSQAGDKEHKTADYLTNARNGELLIGDLPRATLPVIGLWEEESLPEDEST